MKKCTTCLAIKEDTEFSWGNKKRGYLASQCKKCDKKRRKEYLQKVKGTPCKKCGEGIIVSSSRCRKCQLEYERKYLKTPSGKDKIKRANSKLKRKKKELIRKRKEKPCVDCNIQYPYYVMDFDHVKEKEFNIASNYTKVSFKKLLGEIDKCDVVCSNCHRERTQRRIEEK